MIYLECIEGEVFPFRGSYLSLIKGRIYKHNSDSDITYKRKSRYWSRNIGWAGRRLKEISAVEALVLSKGKIYDLP